MFHNNANGGVSIFRIAANSDIDFFCSSF